MVKTTHQAIVVKVKLEPCPNSDNLMVGKVFGYNVVTNKNGWLDQSTFPEIICTFIPPENLCDSRMDQFKFLAKPDKDPWVKISACKLRGNLSEGLFIPAPEGTKEGDDVTQLLNIQHVEDEPEKVEGVSYKPDYFKSHNLSKYDIDGAKNFWKEFQDGEEVVATLKYHGQNMCMMWGKNDGYEGVFIRARTNWQTFDVKDNCHKAYKTRKEVYDRFCKENPNLILWGEAIGGQGGFRYGLAPGIVDFICFDIFNYIEQKFIDYGEWLIICDHYNIPIVKLVYRGPYNFEELKKMAEVPSEWEHPNEGIVIKPVVERKTSKFERLIFKIISPSYKMKNDFDLSGLSIEDLEVLKEKINHRMIQLNGLLENKCTTS